MRTVGRRGFCCAIGTATLGLIVGCGSLKTSRSIDEFINQFMEANRFPGLAVGVVKDKRLVWSQAYGLADIEQKRAMSVDTIGNIASITKTITTVALMQMKEADLVDLDEDINQYLPFQVINPHVPSKPITPRHLLTHTSSITDSDAVYTNYSCGDPTVSLRDWLDEYLTPGGTSYDQEANFAGAEPGSVFNYCNLGFGLLGLIVESLSNMEYNEYCRQFIFAPLGMHDTSCELADIDSSRHLVPYTQTRFGRPIGPVVPLDGGTNSRGNSAGLIANCLYGFPNRPDGLVRTSVRQLARFLISTMNDGEYEQSRILRPDAMKEIYSSQVDRQLLPRDTEAQGLGWYALKFDETGVIWGHAGHDPGVATVMMFRPSDNVGLVALANGAGELDELVRYMFRESDRF